MLKYIILISFLTFFGSIKLTAHQLPQQINPQLVDNNVASEQKIFTEQEIEQWSQYAGTLNIINIAERVNMPILISYQAASLIEAKSKANVECSIYVDPNFYKDMCGDFDKHKPDFMAAATAAIGYCHHRQSEALNQSINTAPKDLLPYFQGPSTFVSSMNETTDGAHHSNYEVNHGLQFHCVEAHDPSEEAEAISNDSDS